MAELCFITTCMSRLSHLQQTLGSAAGQPGCSCVVVDYSCPDQCGDWVERYYPAVKVVRVPDRTYFVAAQARNRGAAAAKAPWLCFFDADVSLQPNFAAHMQPLLQPGHFYLVRPWERELVGTVICPSADFFALGGYDEVFQSWGEQDVDLYERLARRGLIQKEIPRALVDVIRHDDALRVKHFQVKSLAASQTINHLYSLAKFDLMRLLQRELSLEERQHLYQEAHQSVQLWLENNQPTQWRIAFHQDRTIFGQEISSTLVYNLLPLQPAIS